MTKTATITPEQTLQDARQEREALEARIREGDTTITADDLAAIDARIRFAELSIEAAAKRAEDARHQERAARIAAIEKELHALAHDPELAAAHKQLAGAIDAYAAAAVRVSNAHGALYMEAQQLHPERWTFSPWGAQVTTPAGRYGKPDPEQAIVDAASEALKAHGHRDHIRIRKG